MKDASGRCGGQSASDTAHARVVHARVVHARLGQPALLPRPARGTRTARLRPAQHSCLPPAPAAPSGSVPPRGPGRLPGVATARGARRGARRRAHGGTDGGRAPFPAPFILFFILRQNLSNSLTCPSWARSRSPLASRAIPGAGARGGAAVPGPRVPDRAGYSPRGPRPPEPDRRPRGRSALSAVPESGARGEQERGARPNQRSLRPHAGRLYGPRSSCPPPPSRRSQAQSGQGGDSLPSRTARGSGPARLPPSQSLVKITRVERSFERFISTCVSLLLCIRERERKI